MADNNVPVPQSYEQFVGDMLSAYAAKQGISDFNVGSAVTGFFEVMGLVAARTTGDIFSVLRDNSVDRATGSALKKIAADERVPLISAKPATGPVKITDTSFNKISTKIYTGSNPPNIGSIQINVSDASEFTPTGSIYLGRGTPNIEGPIPYSSITPFGGYYIINLSSPTTKYHNLGESVILAQGGNRSININTIVISPSSGAIPDVQFKVTSTAVILDGETVVDNVPVSASIPGSSGNVPRGAIRQFASVPFSGATVINTLPFTTGQDSETDDQLRTRIKKAQASRGLGTDTAIESAIIGATATDEQETIVSSDILKSSIGSIVFVDNGSGYEEKSTGVGLQPIVDSAIGGEKIFQLFTGGHQAPIAKAYLQTTLAAPFDLIGGDVLAITVGNITYQHVFSDSDFRSIGGATAFEVIASINSDTTLGFEASTAGGGSYVTIRAKSETNDSIKVETPTIAGRDAAIQLGFPSNEVQTLRLYKNKIALTKDGKNASIFTQNQQLWSSTIADGDTLILSVDGTAYISYTINNSDFIATGTYTSVSYSNSLESWAEVFNNKLTGITTSVVGQQLEFTSNLDANNRASIVIDPSSTLVSKGMFTSSIGLSSFGQASDFILDRNTAQLELVQPLSVGDQLSAGSTQTEARIQTSLISGGSIVFASDAYLWLLLDSSGQVIPTGVAGNTVITVSTPSTNIYRYTSSISGAFANVQLGDYVIIWSAELNSQHRIEGRIRNIDTGSYSYVDILVTASEWSSIAVPTGITFLDGFTVLRSNNAPQKFKVSSGTKTLTQIVSELQEQTNGIIFSSQNDEFIIAQSVTKNNNGYLLVVTANSQGKLMNFPLATEDNSKDSLIAFYDSQEQESQFPLFIHTTLASGSAADPINSFISSIVSSISLSGRDPNELISFLHPYGLANDAQPKGEHTQVKSILGSTVDLIVPDMINERNIFASRNIRRARVSDRFFVASPFDFGSQDSAVAIVDNNITSQSFNIPMYRRGITNTSLASNPTDFNAYDVEAGPTTNFSDNFGAGFDFSNFKILMRAKKVLKPTPTKTALLYRAAKWGRSGEKINVGYIYPTNPNTDIDSAIFIDSTINININLKSGATIPSSIDNTTEWDVSIVPNIPTAGTDQVTYSWNGNGTNPALSLSGGEYVNINSFTEFDPSNVGVFRISTEIGFAPTTTSFTVARPTGIATAEVDRATLVSNGIIFYSASSTTAADINTYVNTNLSDYISSVIVNDGGTDGSGIIVLSTYEDSDFSYSSVSLLDGINWIDHSDLGTSPQFVLKVSLSLPTDVGYAFNDGEEIRIIPTTVDQINRMISILAVTGFSTVGSIISAERNTRLELATNMLGSDGSIQIVGGIANEYEVPVLDSAIRINNSLMSVSADKVVSSGMHSDQWFKLEASYYQPKSSLFSFNTAISVIGNSPTVGKSTIKLSGRTLSQRYFGSPRDHIRITGKTFRIEKQGSLTCLSWNGSGLSPNFSKLFNLNDVAGGTVNVYVNSPNSAQYIILTGNTNFNEVSIDDLITVSGMPFAENNGTFLVTGVSVDGKTLQVLNAEAVNQFSHGSYVLNANPNIGDQFTITVNSIPAVLVADTDFAIGVTTADTAINLSAVIGTISGVTSTVSGSTVNVIGVVPSSDASIAYTGVASITVNQIAGDIFTAGNFSGVNEVSEGDTLFIPSPTSVDLTSPYRSSIYSNPINTLNQGKFRVIRKYENSVWFKNDNTIEEEQLMPINNIDLGFDSSTSFKVNATNHSIYLNWNGVGTEPTLGNAVMGDVVHFGTDFNSANQGDFMVLRAGIKLQQITAMTMPGQTQLGIGGQYFLINKAGTQNGGTNYDYYVWFNVNGSSVNPFPGNATTGIMVTVTTGDTPSIVATNTANAINSIAVGFLSAVSSGSTVTVSTVNSIETDNTINFNVPSPFVATTTQSGRRTFIECVNPSAVNEATVFISDVLQCYRPCIQFYKYDDTVPGDSLVVTGDTLLSSNAGSYVISEVLDKDTAVVVGTMASVSNSSLSGRETSVYVQEFEPYTGYKKVSFVSAQPGASSRSMIVFDTNNQYSKVNSSAAVQMISLNKLNFNTAIKKGLDSYRYNTGLIAQANRIIYGDPTDPTTYPGVGASGADIFTRAPLIRRVQVSIVCRINTGIPFNQIAEQVRTSVSSLINSNPIGEPIAISSIVSVVNSIFGIKAVSISSPLYDETHDLIAISSGEKSVIIDPVSDILVSSVS